MRHKILFITNRSSENEIIQGGYFEQDEKIIKKLY